MRKCKNAELLAARNETPHTHPANSTVPPTTRMLLLCLSVHALAWEVFISGVSARGSLVQHRKKDVLHHATVRRQHAPQRFNMSAITKTILMELTAVREGSDVTWSHFMEPEVSLPSSKGPTTCPSTHHAAINPAHTIPSYVFTVRFNIVLPFTPRSYKLPICSSFPSKTTYDSLFPHIRSTCHVFYIILNLLTQILGKECKS